MPLRQYQHQALAKIHTGADADALMQAGYGLSARQIFDLEYVANALQRGEKLTAPHIDKLAKVYPAIPRAILAAKAGELNASMASPSAKVALFMSIIAGNDGAAAGVGAHRELQTNRGVAAIAARRHDADARTRSEMTARAARKSPQEVARMLDEYQRRATVAAALDAGRRFREPGQRDHADRLGAAAPVLHGGQAHSLHDTLRAAYDSHAALEYGKEAGIFDESRGVPSPNDADDDIGGHNPL